MENRLSQTEIEQERLNGKFIVLINILKEENRWNKSYSKDIEFYEEKAGWLECDTENVRNLDKICEDNIENMFIIGVHAQQIYNMCKAWRERKE